MAYSKNKNPNYRFLDYLSDERLFDDIAKNFPKKSHRITKIKPLAIFPTNTDYYRAAKTSILSIIVIVMLTVTGFTIFCLIATPEHLVKTEIASIATDYYENYFYNSILENNSLTPDNPDFNKPIMENILKDYTDRGFASISLRELLLYDNRKYTSATEYFEKYCNLDRSNIKIYPEAPFNRQNYRIDYDYSCKF